ncbi:uncharacterized protein LOC114526549 [Dendronephthya gigantea]|uniref:uncharacterized protein LOC114526549 n=1 Tax=Dendronephthya gigantea TaxID=151771 RepID=UPI00106B5C12|nr:uncharacterized protein LOC114526549 [Dendronephthya gigantea]
MEAHASGIEVENTERDKTMVDIMERISECELAMDNQKEKENKEKETAEEMRKQATERIGETRRDTVEKMKRRKRRRNSDVMEALKGSLEMRKQEQQQAKELCEKELNLMETRLHQQQDFTQAMLEQQQLFQQQQAVTMSILNTLAEITKNLKRLILFPIDTFFPILLFTFFVHNSETILFVSPLFISLNFMSYTH